MITAECKQCKTVKNKLDDFNFEPEICDDCVIYDAEKNEQGFVDPF